MSMDKPSAANGLEGLRVTVPPVEGDTVSLLVAHACDTVEMIGRLTGRKPEAAGLIKTIRDEFGR
jgi:hypothetical protein